MLHDRAYSLLGLLDVNMPLLYGEGAAAFRRLQEEMLRVKADLSVLAWSNDREYYIDDPTGTDVALLATDPNDFRNCGNVASIGNMRRSALEGEISLTNVALRVVANVLEKESGELAMILQCRPKNDVTKVFALLLEAGPAHTSNKDAMSLDSIECVCPSKGYRLVSMDALNAIRITKLRNIAIRRYSAGFGVRQLDRVATVGCLQCSHLWLQIEILLRRCCSKFGPSRSGTRLV